MTDHDELHLQRALQALPREIQPERDLWPGIVHAIQHRELRAKGSPTVRRLALAASLLLVLASSLYYGLRQPGISPERVALEAMIAELQSHHQSSKQTLLVQYRDQPAAYEDWQHQMQELEDAEDAIYRALRQDPDNRELLGILRQVQDKQIRLIDAVFSPRLNSI
jgi:hypothetical protein